MTNAPISSAGAASASASVAAFRKSSSFQYASSSLFSSDTKRGGAKAIRSTCLWNNNKFDNGHDGASPFDDQQPSDHRTPRMNKAPSSSASTSRRSFLSLVAVAATASAPLPFFYDPNNALPSPFLANAAETVGKDSSCNGPSCLGVWDGLLADCPHDIKNNKLLKGAGCASSQDDTPGIFAEPWDYSDNIPYGSSDDDTYKVQMDKLILALQSSSKQRGDDVRIAYQEGRYLKAYFTDGASGEKSIGEFYFTPDDTTVQFRLASVGGGIGAASLLGRSSTNVDRSERIRKSLRYLKIPVLRNRKRAFFFGESDDLDGFGPGSNSLGPPEEMSPGELGFGSSNASGGGSFKVGGGSGRTARGSEEVDPRLKIDWVETFPFDGAKR